MALTPPFDHVDESSLFHRTVLGLASAREWEVGAPFGLVREPAVADGRRAVRVVLTATVLRRGGWAPGVPDPQAIAFAVDDVLALARAPRAAGVALLDVGDNYYDDLAARLDLDRGPARRPARHVLLRHDAHGAYLHVVTEVLGGRVFLEAVQRVGGYHGRHGPHARPDGGPPPPARAAPGLMGVRRTPTRARPRGRPAFRAGTAARARSRGRSGRRARPPWRRPQ